MRSPLWFVVAGLIALAGFAGAMLYLMPRLGAVESQMQRIVVPGSAVLMLDRAGDYTIYHEHKTMVDGQYYASNSVPGPYRHGCQRNYWRADQAQRALAWQQLYDGQP